MSEHNEHRDSERADTGPKWVWWSTEESFERGAISVLACAEVAVGIWLYWWLIPWWFNEANLHLLISVLVAPLLLLRSPASVKAALAAFEQYLSRGEGFPLQSTRGAVAMLLAAALSGLASWVTAETWLSECDGWSLFWRAGIMGWISLEIGIVVARAGAPAGAGAVVAAATAAVATAVAVAGTVAGIVAGAAVLAGAVAAAAVGAGAAARAGAVTGAPAVQLGVWLQSTIIKLGETIRHLPEGWGQLSVNWRSLVWTHDLRRPPELLPGIERHPKLGSFGIRRMLARYKSECGLTRVLWAAIGPLSIPFFFIPAWLYRLSLKSTCWFWWPLVFSQTSGRAAARAVAEGGGPGVGVVFEENSKTWLAIFLFGLSVTLLVAAIGVSDDLLALLLVSKGGVNLLDALGHTIYLMLPCAGVQLALFLLCDRFLARAKSGVLGSWPRTAFRWLVSLRQCLLGSALVVALVLYLESWVPVLTPFAKFVETYYFSWFPLLTWT